MESLKQLTSFHLSSPRNWKKIECNSTMQTFHQCPFEIDFPNTKFRENQYRNTKFQCGNSYASWNRVGIWIFDKP